MYYFRIFPGPPFFDHLAISLLLLSYSIATGINGKWFDECHLCICICVKCLHGNLCRISSVCPFHTCNSWQQNNQKAQSKWQSFRYKTSLIHIQYMVMFTIPHIFVLTNKWIWNETDRQTEYKMIQCKYVFVLFTCACARVCMYVCVCLL